MNPRTEMLLGVLAMSALALFVLACNESDDSGETAQRVALIYVGHGEPAAFEDGDVPITLADGTPFGPHAEDLGVTGDARYTEWAAAYEEIATAMTYIFDPEGDLNGNDIPHEVALAPAGDVPPFFTWQAFHEEAGSVIYPAFGNYSPHSDLIAEHVSELKIDVPGAQVDIFVAFLDAVPRIPDVVHEITQAGRYDKLVVVPMLLSSSTHTQEVAAFMHETAGMTAGMDVVVCEPFFDVPFMRERIKRAVAAMAQRLRQSIPAEVPDDAIGVVLASHGTPYVPAFPEFGYVEGDICSDLLLTEDRFHEEIAAELPWATRTGRMNYAAPSIDAALDAFEADGLSHVMVVPSAFPTVAMHTMWDVVKGIHGVSMGAPYHGDAIVPAEGVVALDTVRSPMTVYYTSEGYADQEPGRTEFRDGLAFIGEVGVMQVLR